MVTKKTDLKKIINQYIRELEKRGIRPQRIILYGSYASGKAHAGSDIDLVVISPDLARMHPLKKLELLSLATAKVGAPIEALGYSPEDIRKKGNDSIFWDIVTKTGKEIYPADSVKSDSVKFFKQLWGERKIAEIHQEILKAKKNKII